MAFQGNKHSLPEEEITESENIKFFAMDFTPDRRHNLPEEETTFENRNKISRLHEVPETFVIEDDPMDLDDDLPSAEEVITSRIQPSGIDHLRNHPAAKKESDFQPLRTVFYPRETGSDKIKGEDVSDDFFSQDRENENDFSEEEDTPTGPPVPSRPPNPPAMMMARDAIRNNDLPSFQNVAARLGDEDVVDLFEKIIGEKIICPVKIFEELLKNYFLQKKRRNLNDAMKRMLKKRNQPFCIALLRVVKPDYSQHLYLKMAICRSLFDVVEAFQRDHFVNLDKTYLFNLMLDKQEGEYFVTSGARKKTHLKFI